jgi:hypothetical protein
VNLAEILGPVVTVVAAEDDGALTVTHDGTLASLRTMDIADGLEMVWLIQMLAEDLPLNADLRDRVSASAAKTMFGTVTLTELPGGRADVILRYIFPAGGLDERALQMLVLMALDGGAEIRRTVV